MDKKVELLAPAGDWDSFVAAVENGADAVYLGGKLFNARQNASNFDDEQLKKAVDYAHVRDVKVYLTVNTLIGDHELSEAVDFTGKAWMMGIDGIIVQDLGFAALIKKLIPDMELHASTQMTIYDINAIRKLESYGFKRVVLARELPLEEIQAIARNTSMETEIFIHGALCVCYSGQCLMSSIIGGRSGNRGLCAQPCRLMYQLTGRDFKGHSGESRLIQGSMASGYLLSPKDLCALQLLPQIVNSGVKSLKIEGRMKSPEYVATVVGIYRKYLDRIGQNAEIAHRSENEDESASVTFMDVEEEDMKRLMQIFNRGGFSYGYLLGKTGRAMMCYEKPKNWGVYIGKVVSYDKHDKKIGIKLSEELSVGDGIEIWTERSKNTGISTEQDENPGGIVDEMTAGGRNVKAAKPGETVLVGSFSGKISKGCKVYKTLDKKLIAQARESFTGGFKRKVLLEGKITIKRNQPAKFTVIDNRGNVVEASGVYLPEEAINKPLTRERVEEQLRKTGATPFEFWKLTVDVDDGIALPVSELNNLRRTALEKMEKARMDTGKRQLPEAVFDEDKGGVSSSRIIEYLNAGTNKNAGTNGYTGENEEAGTLHKNALSLMLYGDSLKEFDFRNIRVDRIYLPFRWMLTDDGKRIVENCREAGARAYIWLPSVTWGNYDRLIRSRFDRIMGWGIDGVMVGSMGSLEYFKNYPGLRIMGDHSLNVFNSCTAKVLSELNFSGITLSHELTLRQIEALIAPEGMELEAVVYGRIPLMTSEYCPIGSLTGDGKCNKDACSGTCTRGNYRLKDRKGMEFPVFSDRIDCRSTIFNSNVLFVPESLGRIRDAGVHLMRINITDESPEEIKEIVELHQSILSSESRSFDHYGMIVRKIKDKGFTKGHFFRKVL